MTPGLWDDDWQNKKPSSRWQQTPFQGLSLLHKFRLIRSVHDVWENFHTHKKIMSWYNSRALCWTPTLSFPSESVTITPKDSRWVGAWWMGFMVSSALLLMSSIPFCFLPRSLPVNEELRDKSCPKQTTGNGTNGGMDDNHNLKLGDIAKGTSFCFVFFVFFWVLVQSWCWRCVLSGRVPSVTEATLGNSCLLPASLWKHPEVQLFNRTVYL